MRGLRFGGLYRGRVAEVRPVHIGAQLLTADAALVHPLQHGAMLCRQLAVAIAPKADSLDGHAQLLGDFGRAAGSLDCVMDRIHAQILQL